MRHSGEGGGKARVHDEGDFGWVVLHPAVVPCLLDLGEGPPTTLDCVAKNLQVGNDGGHSRAVPVQACRKGTLRCKGASHNAGCNLFRMAEVACKLAENSALTAAIFAKSVLSNSQSGATHTRCTTTAKHAVALMAPSEESKSETNVCGKVVG